MTRFTFASLAFGMALAAPAAGAAGDYPSQPIKMIVGYAPGGSVDTFARIVAPRLSAELGQTVIIENTPGAGGVIAVTRATTSKPDGYTVLMGIVSDVVLAPLVQSAARYTYQDLTAVAPLGTSGVGLVANPQLGIRSFGDLIQRAKAQPGRLTYGATGVGSLPAVAMESFKKVTGTDITFIPYASASKIATDVIGGNIDLAISGLPALLEIIKSGRVTPIGVMSHERDIGNPDMPSAGDTPELKGMDYYFWTGIFAPKGTPEPVVEKLNQAFARVMAQPDVRERFTTLGVKVSAASPPAQFGRFVADSHAQWAAAIREAGIPRQ
ncbi:Bug family tripartite tricarboxylate transporter substrate binding protein [Bordetella hinzii]|uniref:Bug family tripartite tricarboxylate transporter substrate binding protein n=1 Tax=Bordetella hinzii TaxID=103855 RepID=UPI00045AD303|nr:tripartite tricarboxylate transporter substrate binding protein [Bordetella hinzii]KCB44304.1 tripartite tricarboxylate transporter family receptor [Bordetella hinzii 5132]QWF39482.1 tripartite tricarboxylate transporter substrate binding protein [Bordetella hinzii]QWF44029.1 tripartite tricarboxylate transporter substrate binding protein [Bordetella hinzii]QWF48565.1 tripartite tricarboxylate transporter substrate binding protein [Bordetella hinzii]QWF53102.1 tripartite tricarboxylate tran